VLSVLDDLSPKEATYHMQDGRHLNNHLSDMFRFMLSKGNDKTYIRCLLFCGVQVTVHRDKFL